MTVGSCALRVPGLLALAAAPTFAAMALWNAVAGPSPASMICSPTPGSPLDAMTTMYLLMALFHVPPWLRLGRRAAASPESLPH